MNFLNTLIFTLLCLAAAVVNADLQAPTPDSILYAGERSIIRYDPANYTSNDTVTFFFDEDRSTRLAYGPANTGEFTFVVPENAFTLETRNTSTLIGVFRKNGYLWDVQTVPVRVRFPSRNDTTSSNDTVTDTAVENNA